MKYRPGWTVFHLPSIPGCPARAPLAATAAVGVVGDHSVAYMRRASAGGRRPRFLDGATLARVPPSGAAAYLLAAEWQAHAQHSAEPWRRLLVAWASTQLSSEVTTSASTTPPSQRWPMFRHVPARRRHACSTRACLARSLRLSVCNIMASLHTTATFPGKVKHSFAQVIGQSIISNTLVDGGNSLLRAGNETTRLMFRKSPSSCQKEHNVQNLIGLIRV